jgi:hypothetical protein
MKDFAVKLIFVLEASLAVYFAAGITAASLLGQFRLANLEFMIPGAMILVLSVLSWVVLLSRYTACRCTGALVLFVIAGLIATALASVVYPVIRTGVLWQGPGQSGGAVLSFTISSSLSGQLSGFAVGLLPSVLLIRRLSRGLNGNATPRSA